MGNMAVRSVLWSLFPFRRWIDRVIDRVFLEKPHVFTGSRGALCAHQRASKVRRTGGFGVSPYAQIFFLMCVQYWRVHATLLLLFPISKLSILSRGFGNLTIGSLVTLKYIFLRRCLVYNRVFWEYGNSLFTHLILVCSVRSRYCTNETRALYRVLSVSSHEPVK